MGTNLDERLYNEYLSGETDAFELLYNKYKNKIQYFIFNIVNDFQIAEDITQETFIYAIQNKLRDNSSFKYYIYLVAKSKAINYINKKNRQDKLIDEYYLKETNNEERDVLDIISEIETKNEILESINKLDIKYRNPIYLVNVEEMSYKETAKILGLSLQETKNLIHRGKKKMKKELISSGKVSTTERFSKILIILLCIVIVGSGLSFAAIKIYDNIKTNEDIEIKSYYKDETVTQPISNSKAPIGAVVFKSFNIKENEPKIVYDEWNQTETLNNEKIYYKKIVNYLEYKKLMNNYSNLRPLEENDFKEYFAVVILSENAKESLKYKYITYTSSKENGMNDILHINMTLKENEDKDILYSALVLIMTNRHLDYEILPEVQQ